MADGRLDLRTGDGRAARRPATCYAGLKRIGIDEISIRKGHRYLTVVVDHDTGRLVWAAAGRDKQTVDQVPGSARRAALQAAQAHLLRHGLVDHRPDRRALPERDSLLRPVSLGEALDRRARRHPPRGLERSALRRAKAARGRAQGRPVRLWKNPGNLTERQQLKARPRPADSTNGSTAPTCSPSSSATIYRVPLDQAIALLDAWLTWARRCRLDPFVKLARTITGTARRDRGSAPPRLVERTSRAGEYAAAVDRPPRFQVPLLASRDQPRDARPRRALPLTPRTVTQPTVPAETPFSH